MQEGLVEVVFLVDFFGQHVCRDRGSTLVVCFCVSVSVMEIGAGCIRCHGDGVFQETSDRGHGGSARVCPYCGDGFRATWAVAATIFVV